MKFLLKLESENGIQEYSLNDVISFKVTESNFYYSQKVIYFKRDNDGFLKCCSRIENNRIYIKGYKYIIELED